MRRTASRWILVFFLLLLDYYIFTALNSVLRYEHAVTSIVFPAMFATLSVLTIVCLLLFPALQSDVRYRNLRNYLFAIAIGFLLGKLVTAAFILLDDLRRGAGWVFNQLSGNEVFTAERSSILIWLGAGLGAVLFLSLLYGFSNKYNYRIRHVLLKYPNLPAGFRGFRFVQISDVHSGSFQNKQRVRRGIELILKEKPEAIFFTGDLVNDRAVEMNDYTDVFSELNAPLGVYSVLGNHDYGDYYWGINPQGEQALEKARNLDRLKKLEEEMGWRLLMNEHVVLERNGDQIALIGIENWGAKAGFPKYGRMAQAYRGTEKYPFKILMSHDPSHWEAEVKVKYRDIDLTLSGHTHGMQFGVELPFLKWSPVQWVYKQWAGLYESGHQKLYVNRGFGFLGYPGRVGILPEITVFELQ